MVAPSKLFYPPLNYLHCSQSILHPGIGCFQFFLNNLYRNCIGSIKYFSPLLITPLLMKYKSMNRDLFEKTVKYYLQTVCWSTLVTSSIFYFICCLRNFLGRYRKYTTFFLPAVLGTQFCWFFPSRVLKLFTIATSQATLQGLLRHYSKKFTYLTLHLHLVQTILFMLNSAIILHYKRKNIYKDFWFIQPYEKVDESIEKQQTSVCNEETKVIKAYHQNCAIKCGHTNTICLKFILDGIKSYLVYGISLDMLSMLMKSKISQGTESFMCMCKETGKAFRPNMTGFFIFYAGIYRFSSCLLRKYYSHLSSDLQHILAAFMGGSAYLCVKRINFLILSMVISIRLLWEEFCNGIRITNLGRKLNLALLLIKNAPLSQILFMINCGYLVHNYILNHNIVNNLARGFIDGITCNKTKNLRNFLLNNDLQAITDLAINKNIKTFL